MRSVRGRSQDQLARCRSDLQAQHEDQERIDSAVQFRAERRLGVACPPRDPSVDEVQRERDGSERHERCDRDVPAERGRGQGGDAHRVGNGAGKPSASPAEPRGRIAPGAHARASRSASGRQDRRASLRRRCRPSAQAWPGGTACRRPRRDDRAACRIGLRSLARPQRCSALEHPKDTTVPAMRRFVELP